MCDLNMRIISSMSFPQSVILKWEVVVGASLVKKCFQMQKTMEKVALFGNTLILVFSYLLNDYLLSTNPE